MFDLWRVQAFIATFPREKHRYSFIPDLFVRLIFSDRAMHQHVIAMVSLRSLVFKESCIW